MPSPVTNLPAVDRWRILHRSTVCPPQWVRSAIAYVVACPRSPPTRCDAVLLLILASISQWCLTYCRLDCVVRQEARLFVLKAGQYLCAFYTYCLQVIG